MEIFASVASKGDDLLMSSLVSGVSSKDMNIKTNTCTALGVQGKLHDVFPMVSFCLRGCILRLSSGEGLLKQLFTAQSLQ